MNSTISITFLILSRVVFSEVPWKPKQLNPHGSLENDCKECHAPAFWSPVKKNMSFDHNKVGFPLNGAHLSSACSDCHKDLAFSHVPSACADCHDDVHNGKFGMECDVCHSASKWQEQTVTNETKAHVRFPLVGYHANLECARCHTGQSSDKYTKISSACNDCHMDAYNTASDPNHQANGFHAGCEDCHFYPASEDWRRTRYTHPQAFPLTGNHSKAACADCHKKGYAETPKDCNSCHQEDYIKTTKPNHAELGFSTNCQICHITGDWKVANPVLDGNFTHPSTFPLIGGHLEAKCGACHVAGYENTPTACMDCHEKNFSETKKPPHSEMNFSTKCEECHNVFEWNDATIPTTSVFQHPLTFPLVGGHRSATCSECHSDGYNNTSTECISCHQKDYQNSQLDHQKYNLPNECQLCHTNQEWRGARIPPGFGLIHPKSFPLNQGHRGVSCSECHKIGYANTPADCFSCHKDNYDKAKPSHNGWSHNCLDCHTGNSWKGATFDHEKLFPIKSGKHKLDCNQCHVYSNDFTRFECINCHEHRKKRMDNKHRGKAKNYQYNSAACLDCHPRGRE